MASRTVRKVKQNRNKKNAILKNSNLSRCILSTYVECLENSKSAPFSVVTSTLATSSSWDDKDEFLIVPAIPYNNNIIFSLSSSDSSLYEGVHSTNNKTCFSSSTHLQESDETIKLLGRTDVQRSMRTILVEEGLGDFFESEIRPKLKLARSEDSVLVTPPCKTGESVSGVESTPYKPVPPPRPFGGTGIAASTGSPIRASPLHTHSSKFPIDREVILRSVNKDCKVPVLQEYRRQDRHSVGPEILQRREAWTMETQNRQTQGAGNNAAGPSRSGHQDAECGNPPIPLKQTFIYGNRSECKYDDLSNGANDTKDSTKESKITSKSVTKTYHTLKDMISSRFKGKDNDDSKGNDPEMGLNNVTEEMRKSLRERMEQEANNASANGPRDNIVRKTAGEQGIYGRPVTQQRPPPDAQYARHLMQIQQMQNNSVQGQYQMQQVNMTTITGQSSNQQNLMSQQQFIQQQMLLNQQQHILGHGPSASSTPQHNLVQARSQELLNRQTMETPPRPHSQIVHQLTTPDNIYYQPQYAVSGGNQRREMMGRQLGNYQGDIHQASPSYSGLKQAIGNQLDGDRSNDVRSPQQIERDMLRQRSLAESRRTTSQPQLPHNEEDVDQARERQTPPNPEAINTVMQMRRGSHGNLIEPVRKTPTSVDQEKDSDDGGFRSRMSAHGKSFDSRDGRQSTNSIVQQNIRSIENELRLKNDTNSDVIKSDSIYGSMKSRSYNGVQQRQDSDETNIHGKKVNPGSTASSDYDKNGGPSSNIDSGRGSAAYSSGRRVGHDTSTESDPVPSNVARVGGSEQNASGTKNGHGGESEWVDIVESELRQILEPKLHGMSLGNGGQNGGGRGGSETTSSVTPPLPPITPTQSTPDATPRNSARFKHQSLPYGSKPEYTAENRGAVSNQRQWQQAPKHRGSSSKKQEHSAQYKRHAFGLETDITSTTTRSLDLSSMLDGQSDSDVSTQDARAIRRQLQGLENMYCEVLKLLGVRKPANHGLGKYQADSRLSNRRYGSMSSLPSSSVSSRPVRDKRRNASEQRKKVNDIRGINKRFQRLESHVVTLARSVAHLSSEMRTQHLMIQEMENIRGEITALRNQQRSQSMPRIDSSFCPTTNTYGGLDASSLANPSRVKKLTKFFGDEPPLLRMFLKKLGYEKYAPLLEKERVGAAELPFLGEERLRALGVPLGPRLRILHEARLALPPSNTSHTTLCIV